MAPPPLDHERLEVCQLAIEFIAWVGTLLDEGPLRGCRLTATKHLDEAGSSIAQNIAEGNGKRSCADRARFLDMSRRR
jgi:four helix bundle protein